MTDKEALETLLELFYTNFDGDLVYSYDEYTTVKGNMEDDKKYAEFVGYLRTNNLWPV